MTLFGIEVWQLYPQEGPFWRRDPKTGEVELFERYEDAVCRADSLYQESGLINFSFRAVEYKAGDD